MTGWKQLEKWAAEMPESEAIARHFALKNHFSWVGKMFTRDDALHEWEHLYPDVPFDENIWAVIRDSAEWSRLGIYSEDDWELIADAVRFTKKTLDTNRTV